MVFEMEKGKILNMYKANRLVLCELFQVIGGPLLVDGLKIEIWIESNFE